ncbi:hypothetical protein EVAR_12032_1 [Eumeta japonica]|uniref:Uncharacterized protein n=1 Tax=Eumeta variegata TaxID=151549 RepID=A0A4C1U530_EUMVA|nr:hypothetical protein EVAR_12032_1 [Eumeta japonica]
MDILELRLIVGQLENDQESTSLAKNIKEIQITRNKINQLKSAPLLLLKTGATRQLPSLEVLPVPRSSTMAVIKVEVVKENPAREAWSPRRFQSCTARSAPDLNSPYNLDLEDRGISSLLLDSHLHRFEATRFSDECCRLHGPWGAPDRIAAQNQLSALSA